ncbi:MAG: hypothetical protein LPK07_08470, partial [Hymenobacteraceae bacterium]|nr:hypothetical protein [Hymenobacteraceae bacterium]
GMELAAYYQVDALGTPFAGGSLNAGLRDMARFGELIRNMGSWQGEQIIPRQAVEDIRKGGSKAAFAKSGHPGLKGWSYRKMWWITENEHGAFAARGVVEDIAGAVLYFAAPISAWVSGQVLFVNGGGVQTLD